MLLKYLRPDARYLSRPFGKGLIRHALKHLSKSIVNLELRNDMPFPEGHFYSPIPDFDELQEREDSIWPSSVPDVMGVDLNIDEQKRFVQEDLAKYIDQFDYPKSKSETARDSDYFENNGQFGLLDARALFAILRNGKPSKIIEVGSGYSSLLIADINRRYLDNSIHVTCIEPYPRDFLRMGVTGISRLVEKKVQYVPLKEFELLHDGDVLFIDSSHVSKTGSDVNHIVFELLPRLRSGVLIHFHDIFLPFDYPKTWVLGEKRSWNEQYVLRALLMDSTRYRVLFGSAYCYYVMPDIVRDCLGGTLLGGGSLWIKVASERTSAK